PWRAGLTCLGVSDGPGGPAFAELFRSPAFQLRQLEQLHVGSRRLGDAGAAGLADCPTLAGLTELHLPENDLADTGARAILESPHLRGLREISFWSNRRITDATARAILADRREWVKVQLDDTSVSDSLRAEVAARCGRK